MATSQGSQKQLRDHYLQTLGIVQYVSKEHADEVVIDIPVVKSSEVEAPAPKVSQSSAIESLLQAEPKATPNKKNSAKVVSSSDKVQEETAALALKFVFWQPTDHLLIATAVDDQLPDNQQINLLSNIVAAIDSQSSGLPQFDVVSWPPHASMQGGEPEAREFLSTLISSRLMARSIKILLILGDSAENWLLSAQQKSDINDGLLALSEEAMALTVPSLTQMLSQPQSKRLTWQIICQYFNQHGTSS